MYTIIFAARVGDHLDFKDGWSSRDRSSFLQAPVFTEKSVFFVVSDRLLKVGGYGRGSMQVEATEEDRC